MIILEDGIIPTPIWGYDFSVVGTDENIYPAEPKEGLH